MSTTLSYDKEHAAEYLGAALTAYQTTLRKAIAELAKQKGTSDLVWFDELREDAIRATKGTTADPIPIEVDAGSVRFAFELIDAELQSIRIGLIEDKN